MIQSHSTDVDYFHHHVKRKEPTIGDIYFHDLPEDTHKYK